MDETALTSAARTLHKLLRDVDAASEPVWNNPALDVAIYRYTEIFLPMLAAFHGRNRSKKVVEIYRMARKNLPVALSHSTREYSRTKWTYLSSSYMLRLSVKILPKSFPFHH